MTQKLVRNEPGKRIRAEGGDIRVAFVDEMPLLLAQKLVEEANEILDLVMQGARSDNPKLLEELADLTEVQRAFCGTMSIQVDIEEACWIKYVKEGSFSERLVWKP